MLQFISYRMSKQLDSIVGGETSGVSGWYYCGLYEGTFIWVSWPDVEVVVDGLGVVGASTLVKMYSRAAVLVAPAR